MSTDSEVRGIDYEAQHVHAVYEEIASHFSSTRYKPWPIVEKFLKDLPDGSVGADVGCGNGKYLAVNKNIFILGSDRSTNLVKIARQHPPHSTLVADNLSLPHVPGTLDFAISIAVVHHLSTPDRRIEAISAILDLLQPSLSSNPREGGRALIYVWALEQKDSRRGWDDGHEQDVMVPWVMKTSKQKKETGQQKRDRRKQETIGDETNEGAQMEPEDPNHKTFLRYYHLYRTGELEGDIVKAGGRVVESGYEKDNWWAIAVPSENN